MELGQTSHRGLRLRPLSRWKCDGGYPAFGYYSSSSGGSRGGGRGSSRPNQVTVILGIQPVCILSTRSHHSATCRAKHRQSVTRVHLLLLFWTLLFEPSSKSISPRIKTMLFGLQVCVRTTNTERDHQQKRTSRNSCDPTPLQKAPRS